MAEAAPQPHAAEARFAGEPAVALRGGTAMPLLGLGVWQVRAKETERVVALALDEGYRHVDTASAYGNEDGVGRGIRASGLPREAVFVTTKMRPTRGNPQGELLESLERLGLEYVDLYLIHWPAQGSDRLWPAFERLHAQGLARAIGVSNYDTTHLARLVASSTTPPMVNQIEFHPYFWSPAALEEHRRAGVVLEAYSPLARGRGLDHPTIVAIARRHGRTPAQVLLRWAVQRGIPVIPKSSRAERIAENRRIFDFSLSPDDMAELDGLAMRRRRGVG
jgi:2,5-diketo-D-gluconate reductase A